MNEVRKLIINILYICLFIVDSSVENKFLYYKFNIIFEYLHTEK